jgi:uncharacterized phage protein (TIGR02218 family)
MTDRTWFSGELETVATYWRVLRRDGIALGFTSHDRDLRFAGVLHLSAPGMVPSAIKRSILVEPDSAEMQGALDHAAIRAADLASGRFDGAAVSVGLVDWESGENLELFAGSIGAVGQDGASFTAELLSAKTVLERELVPRTAPTCRAEFCGPGCTLSPPRFTREVRLAEVDATGNGLRFSGLGDATPFAFGQLRWIDGAEAGLDVAVLDADGDWLFLDRAPPAGLDAGTRAILREGCDHTLETCATRFANAVNFQGEPFLPGNDLLTRYANPA